MREVVHQISEAIHESQIMFAVIFGMFIQFFFGDSKTVKVASAIVVSSVFVAMYIVSPAIELIGISDDSRVAVGMYALSSLISMEMLSLLITFMPNMVKERLKKFLEVGK